MTTLVQGNDSIQEFYQKVYAHLSLILNKISCAEFGNEATMLLSKTYREKGLDTFIRGLNGQLPSLLAMKEPTDLPQALQLCLKLKNQNFRASHANRVYRTNNNNNRAPIQQRQPQYNQQMPQYQQQRWQFQQQQPQPSFYPELTYLPRNNQPRQYNNQHNGQLAYEAQSQRVEPMKVDSTMQTQRFNAANKHESNNAKRPASSSNTAPRKHQRTFNLVSNDIEEGDNYHEAIQNQNTDMPYELNEINFLD